MCGRFTLTTPGEVVAETFGLDEAPPALAPRYNIAPTQPIAVIRHEPAGGRRRLLLLRWGLGGSRDPAGRRPLINARAESAWERPALRGSIERRRCLVPADGFFEWKATGGRRQPFFVRMRDGRPFAFAGFWESAQGGEGRPIESCVLLTTEPNGLLRPIHDRMPVILPPEGYDRWLDPGVRGPEALRPFLVPYPAEAMTALRVGPAVNRPGHDTPACIEPMPPERSLF